MFKTKLSVFPLPSWTCISSASSILVISIILMIIYTNSQSYLYLFSCTIQFLTVSMLYLCCVFLPLISFPKPIQYISSREVLFPHARHKLKCNGRDYIMFRPPALPTPSLLQPPFEDTNLCLTHAIYNMQHYAKGHTAGHCIRGELKNPLWETLHS